MDTRQRLLYPLLIVAALSVTVFSMVGIATMTGRLPSAHSQVVDSATHPERQPRFDSVPTDATRADAYRADTARGNSARAETKAGTARQQKSAAACPACGVVESIRVVERDGAASGVGAVAGGVTGAVVGNQFGSGNGRAAMTLIGGLGGALAGNTIEKKVNRTSVYQVKVRMDDGSLRILNPKEQPAFAVGDKVRIENGSLKRRT